MNNGQNNQFQRNSQYNNSSNNYPYGGNPNVPSQNRMINNNSYGAYQNSIPQNQAQQNQSIIIIQRIHNIQLHKPNFLHRVNHK